MPGTKRRFLPVSQPNLLLRTLALLQVLRIFFRRQLPSTY